MSAHYIMSPLESANNLFDNALAINRLRWLSNKTESEKLQVTPIFINENQREKFYALSNLYLKSIETQPKATTTKNSHMIADWLCKISAKNITVEPLNKDDNKAETVLYVQGHGGAGQYSLIDNEYKNWVGIEGITNALRFITADCKKITLKFNSCWSGAGTASHFANLEALYDWVQNQHSAQLNPTGDTTKQNCAAFQPDNSLAAKVKVQLGNHVGPIYGYIGLTGQKSTAPGAKCINAVKVEIKQHNNQGYWVYSLEEMSDPHMAASLEYVHEGQMATMAFRKKLARVKI